MINQGKDVPDNVIAILPHPDYNNTEYLPIDNVIKKPSKKRDWFTSNFYNCRPLVIGNQQGFVVSADFDFTLLWNGGNLPEDITVGFLGDQTKHKMPTIATNFGNGVVSFAYPFQLRTPPGVNLMTIAPPNYIMNNLTVLSGTVETDNLRHPFTFNLRINEPNVFIHITAGTPLSAFVPVRRYFAEEFELKNFEDIFDEETVLEELQAYTDSENRRVLTSQTEEEKLDKHYFKGNDIYGNKFIDFQKP